MVKKTLARHDGVSPNGRRAGKEAVLAGSETTVLERKHMSTSITRSDFLKTAALAGAALGITATGVSTAQAEDAPADLAPFAFTPGTYVSKQSTGFAEMDITCELSEDAITSVTYTVTQTSRKDYSENFRDGIDDLCNRIVEANSPYVDAISGATLCTNVTIAGVKDCMEQAGYEFPAEAAYVVATPEWLGDKPEIDEADIVDTTEADIVIVGGGNAGLACAVTAAEGGKKVVVLEAQDEDNMFWYGLHQIGTVNSKFCMDAGCPEIDKSEFIADWQRRSLGYTNPCLVKKFVDNSGEMVDWLMENSPESVVASTKIELVEGCADEYFANGGDINGYKCWKGTITYPMNAGGFGEGAGAGDVAQESGGKALVAKSESLGAQWFWGYKGIVLETTEEEVPCKIEQVGEDGVDVISDGTETHTRVTGVIAQDADGNYHRFTGESIVLSAGDYGANNAMYKELQQNQRELFDAHGLDISKMRTAGFGRDGSGIKMGMWAGGSMDPIQRTLISPEVVYTSDKYSVNLLIRQGTYRFALWLDSDMQRFCDEEFMGCFGIIEQMERRKFGRFYAFFDSKYKTLLSRSAPEHFCAGRDDSLDETLAHWVERGAEGEETAGGAGETTWSTGTPCHFAANTWEELFEYMGLSDEEAAAAKASIDRYNEMAAAGKDTDFGRDPRVLLPIDEPPFFGMIQVQEKPALGTVSLNGLVIDANQRVLDKNFNPIEGLYASGNNSGGRFGTHYSTPIQGVSLGMALTLGRVLGKELSGQEISK